MAERYIGIGLFAGFDLEKYRHLQDLATALEYWLAGGRDDHSKEMKRLTQRQHSSIEHIAQRMAGSPLLTEIITPILHVPRDGGRKAPPELLAAGKDLMDYAISSAWHPRAHAYQDALSAWKNRRPLQPPGNLHPRYKEMHEAAERYNKFQQEQRERNRPVPGGIESDYTDSDEEQQPKKKKRKKKSATKLTRRSATSPRSSSSSRQPSQPKHIAESGRPNKKRKATSLPDAGVKANTIPLPPLILDLSSPPTRGNSNAAEARFTFLPPLISNRPPPPIRRSSTTTEASSVNRISKTSNQPFPPTRRASAGASTTCLPPNSFDQPLHPQSRRSSRLSQVVNYRDLPPDLEAPQESAPTAAVSEEEETRIRQERRLASIMTYDLPRNELLDGWNPGTITPPRAGVHEENEAYGTQGVEFIFEDPARFAPRKSRGDKAIDDGTIDFSSAIFGTQDDSKLSLDFNTTRLDPKNPGNSIPGERVTNRYHLTVDFNDKNSVRKLNTWRKQIIGRNFPEKKSKTVHAWLLNEKLLVLDLMREQMERRGYIKWNRLTNTYNRRMAGVMQKAGEELVAQGNRKAGVLKEDRKAPWRTKSALAGTKERWPEFRDIVEATLPSVGEDENGQIEEGEAVDSGNDEEEILEHGSGSSA